MSHQSALIESDILGYLKAQEHKSLLRFITCGSVDDGKSTLIGRLLYESKLIYEDQLALMRDVQLKREPFASPTLNINPDIKTLEDLETWVTVDDFEVVGYESHPPIAYQFSV